MSERTGLAQWGTVRAEREAGTRTIRFAALGDSITAGYGDPVPGGWRGWAALLAEGLAPDVSFHNLAVSGALEPPPEFVVHVAPALKIRAWQTHRSQRDYVWRHSHLPPWLLYRLYDDEYYVAYDRARACQYGGRQNSAVGKSLTGSPGQP